MHQGSISDTCYDRQGGFLRGEGFQSGEGLRNGITGKAGEPWHAGRLVGFVCEVRRLKQQIKAEPT